MKLSLKDKKEIIRLYCEEGLGLKTIAKSLLPILDAMCSWGEQHRE